ncbi:ParA family protein [Castellaniella sp. WN]
MTRGIFHLVPEPVVTFDRILESVQDWLKGHHGSLSDLLGHDGSWLLVNRDLNGRVRLILPESCRQDDALRGMWEHLASQLLSRLGPHAYPEPVQVLYEHDLDLACQGASRYPLGRFSNVWMLDRLATETDWAHIEPETTGAPRIVFYSIKGGVGRSTALAATAWQLAQSGKRVLVLDLDLESPGLSSALLSADGQPTYGITDWLVEDLVDNGDAVLDALVAKSDLSHDGEIHVVPAHGAAYGEYIAKLGRVWMPKVHADGRRESWSMRLNRLLVKLEEKIQPDVVLIDSRSGIDEIASACVTELGANLILLFALEGQQTWTGYRMLFEQWQRAGVAEHIRERLQVVGALVPELGPLDYLASLREHAHDVFISTLYDELKPVKLGVGRKLDGTWQVGGLSEGWSFDVADEGAPHYPWAVKWHRSFAGLQSLQGRLAVIDQPEVQSLFGPLLDGVAHVVDITRQLS